ncbi:putative integral membrane protein [Hartmannibacter diazotrophicus]|uniref:Putative integral membrane protein n=1 Tax=Hartmannibacter diazotrophicus TaxID=1482074 RepID=A0A2C9D8E0_9HYPH|nr:putative integral membrane protein [Hartmannibacter diazotrophicus]
MSRRLEAGEPLSWGSLFSAMWAQKGRELSWMAFVVLFVMLMWMYQVRLLLAIFMGFQSFASFDVFIMKVLTTGDGLMFLAIGHLVGAALSLILFSLTVISFPLLVEEDRDFITAMITSVKAVILSPIPMLGWGLIVTLVLVVSLVPFFAGLIVTLPILGHTTWHLYRAAVVRDVRPA